MAAAFRPGARRAIGLPSRCSSSVTKSAVPSGRSATGRSATDEITTKLCGHSRKSDVDSSGSKAALLQVKTITQNHGFVECQPWLRTVPSDELVNGVLISTPRIRRTKASENRVLRVFQIGDAELNLGSALLTVRAFRRCLFHGCRPPRRRTMRLIGQIWTCLLSGSS